METDETTTTDDAPLSLGDAVRLFTAPEPTEDSDEEQPDVDDGQSEESAETDELTEQEGDEETGEEVEDEEQALPEQEGDEQDEETAAEPAEITDLASRVKLPDGTFTTVADLVESGLRRDDYTRKTQETSAEKQNTLAEREKLTQLRQANEEVRAYTIAVLEQFMPKPPDEALYATDIVKAMEQERAYRQRKEQLDYLKAQRDWDTQEAAKQRGEESRELSNAEWAKLIAHPEMTDLKDETKGKALLSAILTYGQKHGYSDQELRGALAFDHRQAVILRKAMAFDALQEAKKTVIPKKTEGRPPVQKSSKRLNPQGMANRDAKVAMTRLDQSGSLKDGVRALLALEKKG